MSRYALTSGTDPRDRRRLPSTLALSILAMLVGCTRTGLRPASRRTIELGMHRVGSTDAIPFAVEVETAVGNEIDAIDSSCDCIDLRTEIDRPGAFRVVGSIQVGGHRGPFEQSIRIRYRGDTPALDLRLTGEMVETLEVLDTTTAIDGRSASCTWTAVVRLPGIASEPSAEILGLEAREVAIQALPGFSDRWKIDARICPRSPRGGIGRVTLRRADGAVLGVIPLDASRPRTVSPTCIWLPVSRRNEPLELLVDDLVTAVALRATRDGRPLPTETRPAEGRLWVDGACADATVGQRVSIDLCCGEDPVDTIEVFVVEG